MTLQLTCRQVAALLISREDQLISITDGVALKLHLLACDTCPHFEMQVSTVSSAMKRWRDYTGDGAPTADTTQ